MESGLSQPVGTYCCHSLEEVYRSSIGKLRLCLFTKKLFLHCVRGIFPQGWQKKLYCWASCAVQKGHKSPEICSIQWKWHCPSEVLGMGGCWMEPAGALFQGVRSCIQRLWMPECWTSLPITCSHCFPIQAQFHFFNVQPYTVLLVHLQCSCCMYLWLCSSRSCASALTSALASTDMAWSQARTCLCE